MTGGVIDEWDEAWAPMFGFLAAGGGSYTLGSRDDQLGIKFREAIGRKNALFSGEAHAVVQSLVQDTLFAYGDVGIYDPEQLAEIDFLNHPEELVELVGKSKNRASRAQKPDMQLLTEVTTKWMQLKVDQKFPPLTPHHTQAFTVLMMCKFFQTQILDTPPKKQKMRYKSFIAQLATGEGKSVVIAMLAIFMVRLYGMRVHVLERHARLRENSESRAFRGLLALLSSSRNPLFQIPSRAVLHHNADFSSSVRVPSAERLEVGDDVRVP